MLNKKQKRTLIEIIITAVLLIITRFIYPLIINNCNQEIIKYNVFYIIQIILYIIAYLCIAGRILLKSIKNISSGRFFDEFFLMSLASIVALCMQEFFEGVAVMLFYQIGELFQSIAVEKSRKSITSLMEIAAVYANKVLENGDLEKIDVEDVQLNDILLVKVGEKIPVDSIVIEGDTTLDTSSLTGESRPFNVSINDQVLSGSINLTSVIKVKAIKKYVDSSVYKILTLIEEASETKGKTEQFITRFAKVYTPTVVILALLLCVIPPLFDSFNFAKWIYRALSFLVISCPCALVISIPLSFFSGIGKCSKRGILVKGGVCLENLNQVNTMFFDKTGTLTTGVFEVLSENNINNDPLFNKIFKGIEMNSIHPIAVAISNYYQNEEHLELNNIEEIPGRGMKALLDHKIILCGNAKLMQEYNIAYKDSIGTVIHLSYDNKYLGYLVLGDKIKEGTEIAIDKIRKQRIKQLIMITGDKDEPASLVADKLKLNKYYSELLPDEKLNIVKSYINSNQKSKIAYVGDGINDAPTLATCDVSFAMGKNGSSLAIETADIVIMDDNLDKVALAKHYAHQTMLVAYINIILALSIKLLCMILSTLGIGGILIAIFADVGVMIICVVLAMLNYYTK